ncbi:cutinase family protein (plasmid) [Rhodococcus pyridinivorans]|uniref:cutinase family protein n=1 Tax=Rhodococcus pyridinivorans TaxID=103816 RepID=UPI0020C61325|nr:cutinase family protein [Rhodococcus pyridinivorans]UTM40068.1 cutinase family protein [Rhodococcus pyridinivorans]
MVAAGAAASLVTVGTATSVSAQPPADITAAALSALPDLGELAQTVDWNALESAANGASLRAPSTASVPNINGDAAAVRGAASMIAGALPANAIVPGSTGTDGIFPGSTQPRCAPTVITAVPGTFETGPAADPTVPVGLLAQVTEPLVQSMGDAVTATFIPYASDASVNGTSYLRSVAMGVQATLATMEDVASRCPESRQILTGFSQGAEIAGDVATAIGQRRTTVDPDSVVAVALFSDPKRRVTSNLLVDTTQTQPDLPLTVQETVKKVVESPSFAQLQMQLSDGFRSLVHQVATQVNEASRTVADATAPTSSVTTTTSAQSPVSPDRPDEDTSTDSSTPASTTGSEPARAGASSSSESASTAPSSVRAAAGASRSSSTAETTPTTTAAASSELDPYRNDPLMQPLDDGTDRVDGSNLTPAPSRATTTTPAQQETSTPERAGASSSDTDGGLARSYAKALAGNTGEAEPQMEVKVNANRKVDVEPVTINAISGGGLSGQRESDFGALTGVVAEICVPGDVVCSLPENSELARQLVQVGKNISGNLGELTSVEGAHRMVGLLSVQAVNTVADVTGLPRTKFSADTLQAFIELIAGVAMTNMGNPAGSALIAKSVAALPNAIPELAAQLADIPQILAQLPHAGDTAMRNLGLDKVVERISQAFAEAGMTSPTQLEKLPEAIPHVLQALAEDNQGLLQLATNPAVYSGNVEHVAFDTIQIAGNQNPYQWVDEWFRKVSVTV